MGGIAAVLLLGLPVGAAAFWKKGDEEKAAVQCLNAEWLARQMHGYQGLLRVKDRDRVMVDNSACLGNIPSISNFRHTTSIAHFRFLKDRGEPCFPTFCWGTGSCWRPVPWKAWKMSCPATACICTACRARNGGGWCLKAPWDWSLTTRLPFSRISMYCTRGCSLPARVRCTFLRRRGRKYAGMPTA